MKMTPEQRADRDARTIGFRVQDGDGDYHLPKSIDFGNGTSRPTTVAIDKSQPMSRDEAVRVLRDARNYWGNSPRTFLVRVLRPKSRATKGLSAELAAKLAAADARGNRLNDDCVALLARAEKAERRIVEMAGEVVTALGINPPGEDAVSSWSVVVDKIDFARRALAKFTALGLERDAATARAEKAEKQRDEAKRAVTANVDSVIACNNELDAARRRRRPPHLRGRALPVRAEERRGRRGWAQRAVGGGEPRPRAGDEGGRAAQQGVRRLRGAPNV